jgi:inhibitor of cysteine peptidase
MTKRNIASVLAVIIVIMLIALFIGPSYFGTQQSTKKGADNYVEEPASIEDIQVVIRESFPVQVNVIVHGEFPDACIENVIVKTQREGSTYIINIIRLLPADAICGEVITPFDKIIQLEVIRLKAGAYVVSVNGVARTFELQSDNIKKYRVS